MTTTASLSIDSLMALPGKIAKIQTTSDHTIERLREYSSRGRSFDIEYWEGKFRQCRVTQVEPTMTGIYEATLTYVEFRPWPQEFKITLN